MKIKQLTVASLLMLGLFSTGVAAKGPTVQVTIVGPGMVEPIHSKSADIIFPSVWGLQFVDAEHGAVSEPPEELARYECHFWVKWGDAIRLKYTVLFVQGSSESVGYVYFPGRRERWYSNNVFSILRPDHDGKWFKASERWGKAVSSTLFSATDNE